MKYKFHGSGTPSRKHVQPSRNINFMRARHHQENMVNPHEIVVPWSSELPPGINFMRVQPPGKVPIQIPNTVIFQ